MGRETILTCAFTGNLTTRDQHPGLLVPPREIAAAALEAAEAGAAVVHLHARDPETGLGSMSLDASRKTVDCIRARNPRVILKLNTGEGGRFVSSEEEPSVAAAGTTLVHPHRRVAHIEAARAPYLTVTIFSDGFSRIVTQLFFDGEDGNGEDPVLLAVPPDRREALLVRRTGATRDGADVYAFDFVLAGAGEMPFFDDLSDTMGDQP